MEDFITITCGFRFSVLTGDLTDYHFEEFESEEDARKASRMLQDALGMGAHTLDAEVIVLESAEIENIRDVKSYRQTVRKCIYAFRGCGA